MNSLSNYYFKGYKTVANSKNVLTRIAGLNSFFFDKLVYLVVKAISISIAIHTHITDSQCHLYCVNVRENCKC